MHSAQEGAAGRGLQEPPGFSTLEPQDESRRIIRDHSRAGVVISLIVCDRQELCFSKEAQRLPWLCITNNKQPEFIESLLLVKCFHMSPHLLLESHTHFYR